MARCTRRSFAAQSALGIAAAAWAGATPGQKSERDVLLQGWTTPERSAMPRTRWWWPGSAVSGQGITTQLEQMSRQGIGGVEIVVVWKFYEKGNIDYASKAWFDMLRHALREAQRLEMTVALVFSPGWDFGSPWIPPDERSKVLAPCWMDFHGPFSYEGPLPLFSDFGTPTTGLFDALAEIEGNPKDHNQTLAVVGARLLDPHTGALDPASLVDLTHDFQGQAGRWRVEDGIYRLFAFRLRYTGQMNSSQDNDPPSWVVDHLSRQAMERYCETYVEMFSRELGPWLGSTVESVFADSFEVVPLRDTILWSNSTLAEFKRRKGYDLVPYLPSLWFDAGKVTPRVRYDLNDTLHQLALEYCFDPFLRACEKLKVKGRIQPHYRFNEEIVEGSGRAHQPETEVTTARFETVADPRKATVSGGRFYGREIVSAEAFTFLHPERYRSTPEEIKRATDAFLRDGITQFYNHGFVYSEERGIAPDRDARWANRISPVSPWWPWYGQLARYTARCCQMMRQGRFEAGVLLYSPQAHVWAEKAVFNIEQRVMKYGDVPKTLLANGFDYDIVNDDLLQHHAKSVEGGVEIAGHAYKVLILPAVKTMPLATAEALAALAAEGLTVIALDVIPDASAGLVGAAEFDAELKRVIGMLFSTGGRLIQYGFRPNRFSPQEQPCEPTPPLTDGQRRLLEIVRSRLSPQLWLRNGAQSNGLTFHQRRLGNTLIYFLTNLQQHGFEGPVTFRVTLAWPEIWDALDGVIRRADAWREVPGGIEVPMRFEPWQSKFIVFHPRSARPPRSRRAEPESVIEINGPWKLTTRGVRFPERVWEMQQLKAWNEFEGLKNFSGAGTYTAEFGVERKLAGRTGSIDLGSVGCVAKVTLNGRLLGAPFMQPFRVEVPKSVLKEKANTIEIEVANTLLAEVQGMTRFPEVEERLQPRLGRMTAEVSPIQLAAWERDHRFSPLPLSGLAGPVLLKVRPR